MLATMRCTVIWGMSGSLLMFLRNVGDLSDYMVNILEYSTFQIRHDALNVNVTLLDITSKNPVEYMAVAFYATQKILINAHFMNKV
jgi:hypothetical protein